MKLILVGGGEAGLHLLSRLSADPSHQLSLVVEPNRDALIHRVESMGFQWHQETFGGKPPMIRTTVESINDVVDPDLLFVATDDNVLVERTRAVVPAGVPMLTLDDLALCDRLRDAVVGAGAPGGPAVGPQEFEEFLDRLSEGASWPVLLERLAWLLEMVSDATGVAFLTHRGWGHRLLLERTGISSQLSLGQCEVVHGAGWQALDQRRPVQLLGDGISSQWGGVIALPMLLEERPIGAVVLLLPDTAASMDQQAVFVLSNLMVRVVGVICRGLQLAWARESMTRDALRRGIKEIIGRDLPADEACQLGVETIAYQLSLSSCRLYCRGPRAKGWVARASAPHTMIEQASDQEPQWGTMFLTAASIEPLLLVQGLTPAAHDTILGGLHGDDGQRLYVPFSLGQQGDGVLVIEHQDMEQWSEQLIELLRELGQLLGTVAQRVTEESSWPPENL